jgi:DNA-binding NtrC family response regulator
VPAAAPFIIVALNRDLPRAEDAARRKCYAYGMPQFDQDAIRRFVRDWKREVASEERINLEKHKKEQAENDMTWLIAFSLVSLAVAVLLCLLLLHQ